MSQEPGFSHRFVAEAREHLASMNAAMIALERNEPNAQPLIERLLRAAHSIKGGAGFTGQHNIERIAHALEAAIENIRDGRIRPGPEVIDTLLATLDRITALIDDIDHSDEADISEPLARIRLLTDAAGSLPAIGADDTSTVPARDFELSDKLLKTWRADRKYLYGVKLDWSQCEQELELIPSAIAQRMLGAGEVLESQTRIGGPSSLREGLPAAPYWLLAIVSSAHDPKEFSRRLDIACATVVPLRQKAGAPNPSEAPKSESSDPPRPRAAQPATSLRVSVPLVDKMMALAGELVLVRNQALRSADPANTQMRRLLRRLNSVTDELQDAALRMRTQPVATLFDRFPRVVRDLARQLGKQIDVHITGSEVELDKTILELLVDPLTHIIRNCCDHGIESPVERHDGGKPPAGCIELSARQERGQIIILIRDDGRGIDVRAVRRKAIEQGVRRSDELDRMTDRQVFGLILLSGFSTAKKVTDLSGRGVGMDVVKTNLDQIGGTVEIDSSSGKGSVFTLRLPLTLAIMPCLLMGADGQSYGVPQRDIEEILLLGAANSRYRIERSHESEVLRWRGRLLPVVRLRELLRHRERFDRVTIHAVAAQ
jgi:two-component system chemotaxis sensor kinase CheA